MKINIIPAPQLSADHLSAWSRLQRSDATLANPFFHPEFTQAVAAERGDVEVAVWERSGEPVGFLPFERASAHVGRPVGSHINEIQGAIARADVAWSPQEFVRAAGLRSWRFDHVAATQTVFAPFQYAVAESTYLDLSQGFEHYRRSRGKAASEHVGDVLRKERKAARELGDVRLEINPTKHAALERLLEWKTDQCRRTHVPCVVGVPGVVRLLERLLGHATEDFAGTLFSLSMGDRLAAAFLAIRSGCVLQGLILGYDRDLGEFAPGLVLMMHIAQAAPELGITRIDMGKGAESYKQKISSGCDYVAEGAVRSRAVLDPVYRGLFHAKDRLRATPLRGPVRRMRRWMLSTRVWLGYTG